jgi:hypothetical protein
MVLGSSGAGRQSRAAQHEDLSDPDRHPGRDRRGEQPDRDRRQVAQLQGGLRVHQVAGNPQWAQLWVEKSRTIFPMQGSVSDSFLKANPWFDVYAKELKKAVPVAPPGLEIYYNDVQKVINAKLVEVLYNNKPVEQAMNEAQAEIEKVIKK